MGFRFRKSVKIGKNTRLNLSKSGIGISTGVKGARVSFNSKGTRTTLSIPGTGISYVTHKSHGSGRNNQGNYVQYSSNEATHTKGTYYPIGGTYYSIGLPIVFIVLTALFFLMNLNTLGAILGIISIMLFRTSLSNKNKAYKLYNKALEAKDDDSKIELLEMAKEMDNNNDLTNYYLASIHYEKGNYKETLDYIKDIKDYKNLNLQMLENMYIVSLFEIGEYQQVINELEGDMEEILGNKLLVALSYKKLGKIKKASEILATGPINKRTYDYVVLKFKYELGLCYLELGEKDKAIRQLKKVYEVNSDFEDIVKYAQELDFAVGEHVE